MRSLPRGSQGTSMRLGTARAASTIVPGASHFLFVDRPDAVRAAFREVVMRARNSGEKTAASK